MIAALAVTLMHALSALPPFPLGVATDGIGVLRSLLLHGIVFSGIFAAISIVRGASQLISPRRGVEAWLARGVVAIALVFFLLYVVLRPLALTGAQGAIVAAAFGVALAAVIRPAGD